MPDNLLALDQHLPRFTGRETLENKVDQVARYEYELLEALRYVIYHLDTRNFNMTEINKWMGSVMDPFNARLEDAEGNITQIKITAKCQRQSEIVRKRRRNFVVFRRKGG